MTDIQKKNIEQLRLRGLGYKRIADALGLSASTVKSHCQRNDLPVCTVSVTPAHDENICKNCGKPLERTNMKKSKSFCCDKCRYAYWNTHQDKRNSAHLLICACCGKAFVSTNRNRKYCGHPCYIKIRFPREGTTSEQGAV